MSESVSSVLESPLISASATLSVHCDQASITLLYFSPSVMTPSMYCCSYSRTRSRVSRTSSSLAAGTTMSSLPMEMPASQACVKPSSMMRSQNSTVSFWPQWR